MFCSFKQALVVCCGVRYKQFTMIELQFRVPFEAMAFSLQVKI